MICTRCNDEPCTCAVPNQSAPHLWIIQHCTRPGCGTAIRSHDGLPESELVCKWCRATDLHGCPFAVYPTHKAHEQETTPAVTSSESVPNP